MSDDGEVGQPAVADAAIVNPSREESCAAREAVVTVRDLVIAVEERVVVDGLSFTIESGRFAGVLGPSGAGKTTLLRALLGLIPIRSGTAQVFGVPVTELGERALRIGYVPQHHDLDRRFPATVRDVVMLGRIAGLGMLRRPRPLDREQVAASLAAVGLEDAAGEPIEALSGLQLRRVSLARALATEPELLLVDEPTTGLVLSEQERFHELLSRLRSQRGLTLLVATRDAASIAAHADELLYVGSLRDPSVRGTAPLDARIEPGSDLPPRPPSRVALATR